MPISAAFYRKIESLDPVFRDIFVSLFEELERSREQSVSKDEFKELKEIVRQLAEAQTRTEARVAELAEAQKRTEMRVEELAEAQKRTEMRVEELAEAQKRTEMRVEELAEAQKRTEARVEELAEAQKRTEARMEELAEAQTRTERELQLLSVEHRKSREQIGGLAMTVGYRLEDEAFKALPRLLKEDYGIEIEGRLKRQYVADNQGRMLEVNIFGKAVRNGGRIIVIGESKSQLSKKMVDEFLRKKLSRFSRVFTEIFPVLVTYMTTQPEVEQYAKEQGVALYYSYDF